MLALGPGRQNVAGYARNRAQIFFFRIESQVAKSEHSSRAAGASDQARDRPTSGRPGCAVLDPRPREQSDMRNVGCWSSSEVKRRFVGSAGEGSATTYAALPLVSNEKRDISPHTSVAAGCVS